MQLVMVKKSSKQAVLCDSDKVVLKDVHSDVLSRPGWLLGGIRQPLQVLWWLCDMRIKAQAWKYQIIYLNKEEHKATWQSTEQ